jgi:hypothetical protein
VLSQAYRGGYGVGLSRWPVLHSAERLDAQPHQGTPPLPDPCDRAVSQVHSYVESCVTAVGQTYDAMLYTIRAFHPSIALPSSPTEVEGYYLSCFNQKRSVLLLDDAGSKEQVSHNAHVGKRYETRWLTTVVRLTWAACVAVVYRSYRCSPNRRVS